jgi:hypothetical protein
MNPNVERRERVGKCQLDPYEAAATFDLALHIGDLELP